MERLWEVTLKFKVRAKDPEEAEMEGLRRIDPDGSFDLSQVHASVNGPIEEVGGS
jgi:hypothetical protein